MKIHWCGVGGLSGPGLRRLLADGFEVKTWGHEGCNNDPFDLDALAGELAEGDIVIAMLPAKWSVSLAQACLAAKAHFIGTNAASPEMEALDQEAEIAGIRLINEIGFAPGFDHILAHWLVADYRAAQAYDVGNEVSFTSYSGGVPMVANARRYKFSRSAKDLLAELSQPSTSIRAFSQMHIKHPWDAMTRRIIPLAQPEQFETYPSLDNMPLLAQYRFGETWRIKEFAYGKLRLNGWHDAWGDIFEQISDGDADQIATLADSLTAQNSYGDGEQDRVVMCVSLLAEQGGIPVYHKTFTVDAWGDARGKAMARLVSEPIALAVQVLQARELPAGVNHATHDPKLVARWIENLHRTAQNVEIVNHLA